MSIRRWIAAASAAGVALAFVLIVAPSAAHHSSAPFYDPDQQVEIEGTVTRFVFRNPHAFLYVDVTDDSGATVEWQIELGAPVMLRRTGWTPETIPIGMMVKASGRPSRAEGSTGICCGRITRADGNPIVEGGRVRELRQPPA